MFILNLNSLDALNFIQIVLLIYKGLIESNGREIMLSAVCYLERAVKLITEL